MTKDGRSFRFNEEMCDEIEKISEREGVSRSEVLRKAFCMIKVYSERREKGPTHIGFVADASKLDAEITGIFGS